MPLLAAIAAATLGLCAFSAQAIKNDDDTLVEGAKLCTRYLPRHERQYGIPEHLLAAIASTESGRYHRALGLNLPWPWTINVEGMGHFYDTKEEAIEAVRSFQARGFASIDVGCMQVNLQHHPRAFASLDQAFDPAYNVGYAAQFLKQNFQEEGSWHKATADYHSHTPMYGEQYARLVYGAWSRIINKVADARAGKPILSASAGNSPLRARTPYHAVRMHDISVARNTEHDTIRENGVIVVRPDYGSQPAATHQANLEDDFVIHPVKNEQQPARIAERSAIAPDGVSVASSGEEVSHGAQIVKVRADGTVTTKGQFQPTVRIVHAGPVDSSSVSNGGITMPGGEDSAKSPFVFNN